MIYQDKEYKELLKIEEKRYPGINDLHKSNYDIYNRLMKICKELDIIALPWAGTSIGVIRHKGAIPWDDDCDTVVREKDVYKLIENEDVINKHGLRLVSPLKKSGRWTNWKVEHLDRDKVGFVDIFMMTKHKLNYRLMVWNWVFMLSVARFYGPFKGRFTRSLFGYITNPLALILPRNLIYKGLMRSANKGDADNRQWVSGLIWFDIIKKKQFTLKKDAFEEKNVSWTKFGNIEIMISKDTERQIKTSIPKFMEMPPVNKRKATHVNEWMPKLKKLKNK